MTAGLLVALGILAACLLAAVAAFLVLALALAAALSRLFQFRADGVQAERPLSPRDMFRFDAAPRPRGRIEVEQRDPAASTADAEGKREVIRQMIRAGVNETVLRDRMGKWGLDPAEFGLTARGNGSASG